MFLSKVQTVLSAFFSNPAACFSETDAEMIGQIIASAADLAVILDSDGIVQDVAGRLGGAPDLNIANWPGKRFDDLVSAAAWARLSDMITAAHPGAAREETVAHASSDGTDIFVTYVAVHAGTAGHILLLGKDISHTIALQEQLSRLQKFTEDRLERHKDDEARYYSLFEAGSRAQGVPHEKNPQADPKPAGVGQVPLRKLVRAQIDIFEKDCIEATLRLTGNNRAATAKVLGLSRQGLYDKLRRYGITSG